MTEKRDPIDTIARTVWAEARGEGKRGMSAVANVIMNRANNPRWWGRNPVDVCLKPWQFSVWNPDSSQRSKLLAVSESDPQFRQALVIAGQALEGELKDETNNADHYHHHAVRPVWSQGRRSVASIGSHRFYRIELGEKKPLRVRDTGEKLTSYVKRTDSVESEDD